MYNYSEYKRFYDKHRYEFGYSLSKKEPLLESLHEMEIKAFLEYRHLDKNKLQEHFFKVINEYQKKVSIESEKKYLNKINYLNRKYKGSDFYSVEKLKFHKIIFDKVHTDTSVFNFGSKRALKESVSINLNHAIAKYSVEKINESSLNIIKLIKIFEYEKETKESMLYQRLKKRFIDIRFETYKDVFINENKFEEIINLLKKHKDIKETESGFIWKRVSDGDKLQVKTSICVLSIILENRNYYKTNPSNKLLVDLLNQFFSTSTNGDHFSYRHYGKIKNRFPPLDDDSLKNYESHFHYIPECKE